MTGVTGFRHMKVWTGTPMKNLLPVWLNGYTIGVAYIHRETRKERNKELDKVSACWPEELSGVDTGGIFIECLHVQYLI